MVDESQIQKDQEVTYLAKLANADRSLLKVSSQREGR